ncbi:hypothetical protein IHE44_0013907 [Lamprotornis superbus]|uniref:Galectin n=1 Tax=Lamprotornis superbus TaxID=245042 RepID=A0A835P195_9PASS|nr:hypothetical protein IHE44_0013907 [Lamprotornis superbus]
MGAVEPYVGEIKGGLRPTMKLTIIGMVHSKPKSFSVTLLCDPVDVNKDIGLLFTVNFSEKSITRNARIAGKWGREEKTIPYFPFTAGDTFKMELLCEHQQIRVLLDGRQLCDFTHRLQPLNLVKALRISGDIKLTKSSRNFSEGSLERVASVLRTPTGLMKFSSISMDARVTASNRDTAKLLEMSQSTRAEPAGRKAALIPRQTILIIETEY